MIRPATLDTERLRLVALLPEEVEALVVGDVERAGRLAGVIFPPGWPEDPEARNGLPWHLQHLRADAIQIPWRIRVIAERSSGSVVGSINLKGPPTAAGEVEIGWGVSEHCRRRGYALEAAAAVAAWAMDQSGAKILTATVPTHNVASQGLAAKLDMILTGDTRRGLPVWRLVPLPAELKQRASVMVSGRYRESRGPSEYMPDGRRRWRLLRGFEPTVVHRGDVSASYIGVANPPDDGILVQGKEYLLLLSPSEAKSAMLRTLEGDRHLDALSEDEVVAILAL